VNLGIKQAFEQEIGTIDYYALNCPGHLDGCNKSPTNVVKTVQVEQKRKNELIEGSLNDKVDKLILLLKEQGIEREWTGNHT